MMMMMMMMMMCKRLAQVPILCVPIYNMKLAMMQKKTPMFITFSAHTKMAADKRGQIEVFAREYTSTMVRIWVITYQLQCEAPKISKLVNITPMSLWFMVRK